MVCPSPIGEQETATSTTRTVALTAATWRTDEKAVVTAWLKSTVMIRLFGLSTRGA